MTTADYPITAIPYVVFQSGQNQPRYGLTNTGANTIFVSPTPQMTTTDGWPLNPQATMPWSAGKMLSAVCPDPAGSTLQTLDADVGLFDPSAIATQTNLVGVPPVDQPAQLYSRLLTGATAIASGATPPDTPGIDCTRYQGVFLAGQNAGVTNLTATRVYTLSWYADSTLQGSSRLATEKFTLATFSSTFQVARPVRGAFLVVSMTSAITTTPDANRLFVYGTMRPVNTRTYLTSGLNNATGLLVPPTDAVEGIIIWSGTITGVGATKTEFPDALMGCQATVDFRSTATLSDLMAIDFQSFAGQSYGSLALGPNVAEVNRTIWLPPIPMSIGLINFSTGTPDFQAAIVMEPQ